jgi:folylpolyglutamate synthase/dihydropteroate synthase
VDSIRNVNGEIWGEVFYGDPDTIEAIAREKGGLIRKGHRDAADWDPAQAGQAHARSAHREHTETHRMARSRSCRCRLDACAAEPSTDNELMLSLMLTDHNLSGPAAAGQG